MYEYAQQFSQYKTKDAIIEMKKCAGAASGRSL